MGDIEKQQVAMPVVPGGLLNVEGFEFPATLTTAPGSAKTFFLGGAGVRGLQIQDRFIKFTVIGVYLEQQTAISSLSAKWKAKTADQLMDSVEFFRDVVTGPFEKFIRVTMIMPLTGKQYSEKVVENCVAGWKAMGCYTEAEAKAIEEFIQVFKDETFPPSSSILFTQSSPTLTIGFSKDGTIPKDGNAKIENKLLSEAFLESIIGKHGVSPGAKRSLAERLSQMMSEKEEAIVASPEKVVTSDEAAVATPEKVVTSDEAAVATPENVISEETVVAAPEKVIST